MFKELWCKGSFSCFKDLLHFIYLFINYQIFYLFTFQMLTPFLVSPPQPLYQIPIPCFCEGPPPPTHPHPSHHHSMPLHWGLEPSQDQGPPLPLMLDKPIPCYICSCRHGLLHVYTLVGGLIPGSSWGGLCWLILLFFLRGCNPLHILQSFL